MHAASFPDNMPAVWDALWGELPERTGVPVVLGEWGGLWHEAWVFRKFVPATAIWQTALQGYLNRKRISFFYWALNDVRLFIA